MFDIAPSEFLLVAFIALVVIGPKDLPKAMRVVGYWVGRARAVGRQFRAGFDEMVREAELVEMEKKWKEENERIMREHPAVRPEPEALPAPSDVPLDQPVQAAEPHGDEQPPVMVEKPHVEPAPEAHPADPVDTSQPASAAPASYTTPEPPSDRSDVERRRKPSQSDLFAQAADASPEGKAQS